MADAVIHVLPEGLGPDQYDAVNAELDVQGARPAGLQSHAAGKADDGRMRIIEVWDSRASFDRFNEERLTPAIAKVTGMPAEEIPASDHTWFAVHQQLGE
ncbi:MAG: hypothetical protein ACRDK1_04650 [Solirubrobacterales bacterium]